MTIQELIDALNGIGNKELPVCAHDGTDMSVVHQLVVEERTYWDGNNFRSGLILEIRGG